MKKTTIGPFEPMKPLTKEIWEAQVNFIMHLKRNKIPLMLSGQMYKNFKKLTDEQQKELIAMYEDIS